MVDQHRTQLLFYAGLVQATFDEWPELELAPVGTARVQVSYQPEEVEAALADREALNESLLSANVAASVHATARRCGWCSFQVVRPVLLDEWDTLEATAEAPLHRAVSLARGVVREVRSGTASTDAVITQERNLTRLPARC